MEAEVAGIKGDAPFDVIVGHFVSMGGECVLMDPDMICGRDHVLSALIHAERAFSEGTNRSRTLPTEIIMYCAWERQIPISFGLSKAMFPSSSMGILRTV